MRAWELNEDSVRELAATVLKRAVEEDDLDAPLLELWCDVLGLEPSLYFEKARRVINDEKTST